MPKRMRVILAVLLLAIAVAWLALRAWPGEEPSPSGTPQASSRSDSSSATASPRAMEEAAEEIEDLSELEGPGPCIEIVVTAQGVPVGNAKVIAVRREANHDTTELGPLKVGPEGRRRAWCQPGAYQLVAYAPGFARKMLDLTVSAGSTPVARFDLDGGHTLFGRVLDKDSEQPIAGAKLRVASFDNESFFLSPSLYLTSDAKGLFRVDSLAAGTYQVEVEVPRHNGFPKTIKVPRPEGLTLEIEGTSQLEGTSRLEGQAVDSAGAPVPGAQVWPLLGEQFPKEEAPTRTDAQGRFSLDVDEGTYRLAASAGSLFGLHEGGVTVARGGLVDGLIIRLHSTGSLAGKVFMQASREPIGGARLMLRHAGSGLNRQALSDASGGFRVEQLVPGTYSLMLSQRGFSMIRREGVLIQAGQETSVEFALVRNASVKGSVTDALGRPSEQASVIAQAASELQGRPSRFSASTDKAGQYHLLDLPPGSYRLEARLTRQGTPVVQEISVQEGEEVRADFVLPEALGHVEGIVQRSSGGPPLHPVDVKVVSPQGSQLLALFPRGELGAGALLGRLRNGDSDPPPVAMDDKGRFTLPLLPGSYTFTATYRDTQEPGPAVPVTVEAGRLSRVTLTVSDSFTETSGVVLSRHGEPVSNVSVMLERGGTTLASTTTDEGGQFSLRTAQSSAGTAVTVHVSSTEGEGELKNVPVGSQNVVVRLQRLGALRGRISASRGPPVQGFELQTVWLFEGSSRPEAIGASPFAGDTFEMVDLSMGSLELLALTSDGRSGKATVSITSGQTSNVEISVGRLGSVKGRLVGGTSGVPITDWVTVDPGTPAALAFSTSPRGHFRLFALEPGAHVLEVGPMQRLSFTLREGETLELGDVDLAKVPKAP